MRLFQRLLRHHYSLRYRKVTCYTCTHVRALRVRSVKGKQLHPLLSPTQKKTLSGEISALIGQAL